MLQRWLQRACLRRKYNGRIEWRITGLDYEKFSNFQDYKDHAEREFIKFKLEKNNWNVSKTADDIDIQRSHLYSKIEKFGLKRVAE